LIHEIIFRKEGANMLKKILIVTVLLVSVLSYITPGFSTTLLPVGLPDLVTESEVIFVGTVAKIESDVGINNRIYTQVTFENLQIIKGIHPDSTLVMRLAGGTIGEYHSKIIGMPEFQVGGKHLIFLRGNQKHLCPIVGWSQGKFNVVMDKVTGVEIVLDDKNNPIIGIQENSISRVPRPVERKGESFPGNSPEHGVPTPKLSQAMDSGKRLSLPDFIADIENRLGLSGERRTQ
jgi:hypothetical protein